MRLIRACLIFGFIMGAAAAHAQACFGATRPILEGPFTGGMPLVGKVVAPLNPSASLMPRLSPAPLRPLVLTAPAIARTPFLASGAVPIPAKSEDAPELQAARAGAFFDQSEAIGRLTARIPGAVLLDWDDTLTDQRPVVRATREELFRRFGSKMPPYAEVERQWRANHDAFYTRFFPGAPRAAVEGAWHEIMERFRHGETINGKRFQLAPLLPGAVEVLEALQKLNVPLALVSNKREDSLLEELAASGLGRYFQHVYGHKDGRLSKPSSQPIDATLKTMGIAPGNVWYIGDQLSDMEAARGEGMLRVLIGRQQAEMARERGMQNDPAGAIVFIDALRKLTSILLRLPAR